MRDPYNPSDHPSESIRTDLWETMNISELANQQDLVIDKLSKLTSIMGRGPSESYKTMYGALQQALEDLNQLLDYRTNHKPTATED